MTAAVQAGRLQASGAYRELMRMYDDEIAAQASMLRYVEERVVELDVPVDTLTRRFLAGVVVAGEESVSVLCGLLRGARQSIDESLDALAAAESKPATEDSSAVDALLAAVEPLR